MDTKKTGLMFAILSSILSSVSLIFLSGAVKLLGPLVSAFAVTSLASAILLGYLVLRKKLPSKADFMKVKKDFFALTLFRAIIATLLIMYGLTLTTGIKTIFLTKVEPYIVLFLYWIIQKGHVRKSHLVLLGIHVIGAILLSVGGALEFGVTQLGDLLIVLGIIALAISYIYGKRTTEVLGATATNGLSLGVAGIVFLPLALFLAPVTAWDPSSIGWTYLAIDILLFQIVGLTFWYISLKSVRTWMVSALRAIGPLVGAPVAFFLFSETLSPIQILGGIIIIVTSALIAKDHLKK